MHDYTVRLLNDHHLNQFDKEADVSRLRSEARKRQSPPDRPEGIQKLTTYFLARWAVEHVRWALTKARGA